MFSPQQATLLLAVPLSDVQVAQVVAWPVTKAATVGTPK
jgi:hypothetical protein